MLHPVDDLALELLLDGKVRHAGKRSGSVPVLLTGRKPNDIARANLLDRSTFALRPPTTRGDDERLSKRMCVPRGPRARLERHTGAGSGAWKRGSTRTFPVNHSAGPFADGCEPAF